LTLPNMFIRFMERDVKDSLGNDSTGSSTDRKMNGKYNSSAALPAISVSYKF